MTPVGGSLLFGDDDPEWKLTDHQWVEVMQLFTVEEATLLWGAPPWVRVPGEWADWAYD